MTGHIDKSNEAIRSAVAQSKKIDAIVIEQDALRQVPFLLREHFNASRVFIIADENTMAAAGKDLSKDLTEGGFDTTAHVFPATPYLKAKVENAPVTIASPTMISRPPITRSISFMWRLMRFIMPMARVMNIAASRNGMPRPAA